MFVEERHALIIQELKENGRVKVKELSAKFKVSEDLIRKDLALLAQQGKLKKNVWRSCINKGKCASRICYTKKIH